MNWTPDRSTEEMVRDICVEVLRQEIGIQDDILAHGVESILRRGSWQESGRSCRSICRYLRYFTSRPIAELATIVDAQQVQAEKPPPIPLQTVDRRSELPLSYAQERMWFLHRLDPNGSAYNMSSALHLRGAIDPVSLQRSIDSLVQRHETLRTTFLP